MCTLLPVEARKVLSLNMTTSLIMYCKPFSACEQIGEQMKGGSVLPLVKYWTNMTLPSLNTDRRYTFQKYGTCIEER